MNLKSPRLENWQEREIQLIKQLHEQVIKLEKRIQVIEIKMKQHSE